MKRSWQLAVSSWQKGIQNILSRRLSTINHQLSTGFTLIETLVAITLLTISVVAPMTLVARSLTTAYYSRDQITAFHLAQEGIEAVRHLRDHNILETALDTPTNILAGIRTDRPFTVDAVNGTIDNPPCTSTTCPPLQTDPTKTFYGYGSGWTNTSFTRTVRAVTVRSDAGVPQEVRITVTVSWRTGSLQTRTITISENLYRWVRDST